MTATVTVSASGVSYIDGLLYGTKWASTNLTYSFPTVAAEVTGYSSAIDPAYFTALSGGEQSDVEAILAAWSDVSGITFTRSSNPSDSDIRIYFYESPDNWTAQVVDFPGPSAEAGDIQIGTAVRPGFSGGLAPGSYAYLTMLHEVGHALGLKHPHNALNGFDELDIAMDGIENAVMSYRSSVGGPMAGYTLDPGSYPMGPMVYDIAAVQYLYGSNTAFLTGDTTVTFDPAAPVAFLTWWDGAGDDTYDFSNYTTNLTINLEPGAWSDLGSQYAVLDFTDPSIRPAGNIRNAYLDASGNGLIENARGGSGNDQLTGNAGDNWLWGEGGDDRLAAGAGTNLLDGGDDRDTAVFATSWANVAIQQNLDLSWAVDDRRSGQPLGSNTLVAVERIEFSDRIVTFANAPTAPTDADMSAGGAVAYGVAPGFHVGITAAATDQDADDTVTYLLLDDAGGRFAIDAASGIVTVAGGSFTPSTVVRITVGATDGAHVTSATFDIAVGAAPAPEPEPPRKTEPDPPPQPAPIIPGGATVVLVTPNADGTPVTVQGNPGATDEVRAATNIVLGEDLENAYLYGTGNYTVQGNGLDNIIFGNPGNNTFIASGGNDVIDGGLGFNTVRFEGSAKDYTVEIVNGVAVVTHTRTGDVSTLANIAQIEFADASQPLFTTSQGVVAAFYKVFMGRAFDEAGFSYWMEQSAHGLDATQLAQIFVGSQEFQNRIAQQSPEEFVRTLYTTFLNRDPDPAGLAFWTDAITRNGSYGGAGLSFALSPEFSARFDELNHRADWLFS